MKVGHLLRRRSNNQEIILKKKSIICPSPISHYIWGTTSGVHKSPSIWRTSFETPRYPYLKSKVHTWLLSSNSTNYMDKETWPYALPVRPYVSSLMIKCQGPYLWSIGRSLDACHLCAHMSPKWISQNFAQALLGRPLEEQCWMAGRHGSR